MTHPLTSEMVQSIWDQVGNEKSGGFTQDDLMRAAADWQLEQCIAWLEGYDPEGWAAGFMRDDLRPQDVVQSSQVNKEDNSACIDIQDQFGKLYRHVLKLEERIKALEKKHDDDESYYQEQQENYS